MKSTIILFFAIFIAGLTCVQAFNCSGIVDIENESQLSYLANVSFTVPKALDGDWTMEMKTDVPFTFLGGWGIWVQSNPDEGAASFRSRLENNTLAEGDQISFRFRISWFTGEERPIVKSLSWEGVQLCTRSVEEIGKPITASRQRRTSFDGTTSGQRRRVNYRKRYFINL